MNNSKAFIGKFSFTQCLIFASTAFSAFLGTSIAYGDCIWQTQGFGNYESETFGAINVRSDQAYAFYNNGPLSLNGTIEYEPGLSIDYFTGSQYTEMPLLGVNSCENGLRIRRDNFNGPGAAININTTSWHDFTSSGLMLAKSLRFSIFGSLAPGDTVRFQYSGWVDLNGQSSGGAQIALGGDLLEITNDTGEQLDFFKDYPGISVLGCYAPDARRSGITMSSQIIIGSSSSGDSWINFSSVNDSGQFGIRMSSVPEPSASLVLSVVAFSALVRRNRQIFKACGQN